MAMERYRKLRRCLLLCSHFTRNLAYYRAGWENGELKRKDPFWLTLNSDFLDICVLEWCKLFGDYKDKYHWKKIVDAPDDFKKEMFRKLGIEQINFDELWESIRSYRDKFVAHLDDEETGMIPKFDLALEMVIFYHENVKKAFKEEWQLTGLPLDLRAYYDDSLTEAKQQYKA